ncbi:MAG TPA: hypothetical protein VNR70_15200 [Steroidobacteraceae bacterium]|jgi:hypothetical protein|nr:hypothetical protein [Steroidobacteraceae bacterium]
MQNSFRTPLIVQTAFALVFALASASVVRAEDPPADTKASAAQEARAATKAIKHDAEVVGGAVKDGAQKVGVAAKEVAIEVADAAQQGAHEVAAAAKSGVAKTKAAVTPDKKSPPKPEE